MEKVLYGISNALYAAFGEGYGIYSDDVNQDLSPPCFLITPLNTVRAAGLGNRYKQTQSFDVYYFPQAEKGTVECAAILNRLLDAMEYITVDGDLVRGAGMHGEIHEGVLHFFVDYTMFLVKKEEKVHMEEAEIGIERKKR